MYISIIKCTLSTIVGKYLMYRFGSIYLVIVVQSYNINQCLRKNVFDNIVNPQCECDKPKQLLF